VGELLEKVPPHPLKTLEKFSAKPFAAAVVL
jgi:hypothetical protein